MLLYWAISPARVACAFGSATGAAAASPLKAWPAAVAVPVIAPIVDEAALLLVVRVMTPVGSMVACRLLAASAALSWFSDDTWPAPVPKVMLVAVPPPVAAISSVSPLSDGEAPVAAWVTPPERPRAVSAAALLEEMLSVPLTVPVCSVMTPPEIDEAVPLLPLAVSIAASRLATVPVVEIWLAPAVPDTKVSVLPSTTRVSPALKPLVRAADGGGSGSRQQRGAGQRRGAGGAAAARQGDAGAKAETGQRVAGAGDGQVGGGAGLQSRACRPRPWSRSRR